MNYDIDIFDIKTHCMMMNCDCACIVTGEFCPLCDFEKGCLIKQDPADWDLPRIKEGFEKIKAFNYGMKRFDYI